MGLVSVKQKATAFLIKTFLELAANSNFLTSQCLNIFYRSRILGEDIVSPPLPPYYTTSFINSICEAKAEGKDIIKMSTRQLYYYLLDQDVLKVTEADGAKVNEKCRIERKHPELDWNATWEKVRASFLSSNAFSFMWKLIHDILATKERIQATIGNVSERCRHG